MQARLRYIPFMKLFWTSLFTASLLLLASFASLAQEDELFLYGYVKHKSTNKKLAGITVSVLKDGSQIDTYTTSANGKFEFYVPLGSRYAIQFSAPDFITRNVVFDTRNIPEEDRAGGFKSEVFMTLFEKVEGFNTKITDEPIGKAAFDPIKNSIEFDLDYTSRQQNKIEQEFKRLENLGAEIEKLRKEFEELIDKGDQKMSGSKFQEALGKYEQAINTANEIGEEPLITLAQDKRDEAQAKIDEMDAAAAEEAKYQGLIASGNSNMKSKSWEDARKDFKEASAMRPTEKLPKDKLKEIDDILKGLADKEAYDALLAKADGYFEDEDYALAIDNYKAASKMLPAEDYPRDQMKKAQELLDALLDAEALKAKKQKDYDDLITRADRNFKDKAYENALSAYEDALDIFPDEKHPQNRVEEIKGILADLAAKADKNASEQAAKDEQERIDKEYKALIDAANIKFDGEKLSEARADYVSASELKPTEKYPKGRIKRIDELLADANKASAKVDQAALDEEKRLAAEKAEADRLERERLAEEERKRRMDEDQSERDRIAEERARKEQEEKDRRARFLNNVDTAKEDEVERYYREARESEEAAKAKQKEKEKEEYGKFLASRGSDSEAWREDNQREANNERDKMVAIYRDGQMIQESRDKVIEKEKEKEEKFKRDNTTSSQERRENNEERADQEEESYALLTKNDVHREHHINQVEKKKKTVAESEASQRNRGNALRQDNEYESGRQKETLSALSRKGEEVRLENVDEVVARKEEIAESEADVLAASKERLASQAYQKEKEKEILSDIAHEKAEQTVDNEIAVTQQKDEQAAFLNEQNRASANKRYDNRKAAFEKDAGGEKDVDDYVLPAGSEDLPEGVTEESYQLNDRTVVIERTVKIGNKIDTYRKVVSKTGTYYFKNNRAITELTWKSETLDLGD